MSASNERPYPPQSNAAAAAVTLLLGLAASAAALLLTTPQGKQFLAQFAGRTEAWKLAAASTLAESREKMVSSVEAQKPPEQEGRLRENL